MLFWGRVSTVALRFLEDPGTAGSRRTPDATPAPRVPRHTIQAFLAELETPQTESLYSCVTMLRQDPLLRVTNPRSFCADPQGRQPVYEIEDFPSKIIHFINRISGRS